MKRERESTKLKLKKVSSGVFIIREPKYVRNSDTGSIYSYAILGHTGYYYW